MKPVIIYPPTIDWDQLHQRPQQLLKALSRLEAVSVFCNLNLHKRHAVGIEQLSPTLVLANEMPFNQAATWARRAYPQSPIVVYFTYPPQSHFLRAARIDLIVFDSVDEPTGEFAGWQNGYDTAVTESHIILASAVSLQDRAQQATNKSVHLLPNGCDFAHFQQSQSAEPLTEPPFGTGKPVIGYMGAIAPWLDSSLINTMARELPQFDFVYIGAPLLLPGICFANKNMHYLGHRDYQSLPRYLASFDYCLIPFRLTAMTRGVNPVKFWEYLASGKPILSTRLPEIPEQVVTFISEDMFPGFVPHPDNEGRASRIRLAQQNSWDMRARKLIDIIQNTLANG